MKCVLILALAVVILVSVFCMPSFALNTELPFIPTSPHKQPSIPESSHEHHFIEGVCSSCHIECAHIELDEITHTCKTCEMNFSSVLIASDDSNELSLRGFLGILSGAFVIFGVIYFVSLLKARKH